jgi:hypothetical protein
LGSGHGQSGGRKEEARSEAEANGHLYYCWFR